MANREKGEVSFDALGKSWVIRYNTNAMCEIEDALDQPIIKIANQLQDEQGVSLKILRTLFRFGVVDCSDYDEAGDIMDSVSVPRAGELIGQAFQLAFPSDEGEGEGKQIATSK